MTTRTVQECVEELRQAARDRVAGMWSRSASDAALLRFDNAATAMVAAEQAEKQGSR